MADPVGIIRGAPAESGPELRRHPLQLSRELRFRTDFNRPRRRDGVVTALIGFGGSTNPPDPGDVARLFDGDGNTCLAVVVRHENDLVYAKPDWTTWRTGVQFEVTDLFEALKRSVESARAQKQARVPDAETKSVMPEFFELKVG